MRTASTILTTCALACTLVLSGCYQAQVTTNKPAGNTVVEEGWAPSYLMGLVPASVDVSNQCPNGISSATREYSFPNLLVSVLTIGIYAPQNVTVTCASESMSSGVPSAEPDVVISETVSQDELRSTIARAVQEAALSQTSVNVRVLTEEAH